MSRNETALSLDLFWHHMKIGELDRSIDGRWNYQHDNSFAAPFPFASEKILPNGLPAFLASMLPEKLMFGATHSHGEASIHGIKTRLLSSLSIHPRGQKPSAVNDLIDGDLEEFCPPGTYFSGQYQGMPKRLFSDDGSTYSPEIIDLVYRAEMPRVSGCQVKIPSYLSSDGVLSPAIGLPFTHLLKVPGPTFPHDMLCASEWYATTLAAMAHVETEKFGIAQAPFGVCFIAQRFDIHTRGNAELRKSMLLCEDMTSVMGIDARSKYGITMEDVARAVIESSTDPNADSEALIRQCVANWVLINSDYHAKNISLLKEVSDDGKLISSKLSPAYDIVCCRGITSMENMALPIDGSLDMDGRSIRHLAEYMREFSSHAITKEKAEAIAVEVASRIERYAPFIPHALPSILRNDKMIPRHLELASGAITERAKALINDIEHTKTATKTFRPL